MVSTPPVPPDGPGDHDDLDPTGIRALLSALPDPGPMPHDLVDRINASIAAEQTARQTTREGATVVPLRSRRWGWQHWGAAAAAAAVIVVGGSALVSGTGPGDVLASIRGGSSADSDSSAGDSAASAPELQSGTGSSMSAPSTGGQRVQGSVGDVQLVASGTAYTSTDLGKQAGERLPAALQDSAKAEEARPDSGAGLRACLTALGIPSSTPIRADVATLDGAPAVIAVVQADTGQTVYAVAPECDATHPRVLAGPVPVR